MEVAMFDITPAAYSGMAIATAPLLATMFIFAPIAGQLSKSVGIHADMPSQQMSKTLRKVL